MIEGIQRRNRWRNNVFCLFVLGLFLAKATFAQSNQAVFTDSLQNGWENWSWATVNLTNSSPVHGGTRSISVATDAWEAAYFHHSAMDASYFTNLTFWIHGG